MPSVFIQRAKVLDGQEVVGGHIVFLLGDFPRAFRGGRLEGGFAPAMRGLRGDFVEVGCEAEVELPPGLLALFGQVGEE